jgi:hypothetical protein
MKNVDMYGFAQKVFQCPYGYFHHDSIIRDLTLMMEFFEAQSPVIGL